MSTKTIPRTQIAPLMQTLEVAREISQQEHRAALKLKLRNKIQEQRIFTQAPVTTRSSRTSAKGSSRANHHPLFTDPSGNDALLLAAKRSFVREHIAKVAIMKQMGIKTIPTFAEVWEAYLERMNNNDTSEGCCTTSSCGCGSNH